MPGDDWAPKFKEITNSSFTEQGIWFLNGFWNDGLDKVCLDFSLSPSLLFSDPSSSFSKLRKSGLGCTCALKLNLVLCNDVHREKKKCSGKPKMYGSKTNDTKEGNELVPFFEKYNPQNILFFFWGEREGIKAHLKPRFLFVFFFLRQWM